MLIYLNRAQNYYKSSGLPNLFAIFINRSFLTLWSLHKHTVPDSRTRYGDRNRRGCLFLVGNLETNEQGAWLCWTIEVA